MQRARYVDGVLVILVAAALSFSALSAVASEPDAKLSPEHLEFFEKQVRPLLAKRCFACHAGAKASGGLSLEKAAGWKNGGESGPAIVAGKPDESLLIDAIHYRSLQMPPPDEGGKLPDDEIRILTEWVAMGAPDPRDGSDSIGGMSREAAKSWWAFQPLLVVEPGIEPKISPEVGAKHIDSLLQREIDRQGMQTTAPADKRTLLRRLAYDLTGLPPTPEEVESFQADESPEAFALAIDRLLASDQYGVHWGRRWLDVVRYADTAGENTDRPLPHAWRYRNWVFDAFHRDMPFDRFIRLQIAGDLTATNKSGSERAEGNESGSERAEGIIATGYLAIARRYGHDINKDMYLTYEDVIDNLGKNFLGLTLGCARCHDHKYDPVSAEDYYALYGIFASTRFAFPGCEPEGQPRDLTPLLSPAELDALMKPWQEKVAQAAAEKERREAAARPAREKIQSLWNSSKRSLAEATVGEGDSAQFSQRLEVRRGEVVLLSVSPNGSHGADSTLVEWTIRETATAGRQWSVGELVSDLTRSNPYPAADGAQWSFLDVAPLPATSLTPSSAFSPAYLAQRRESINENSDLKAWRGAFPFCTGRTPPIGRAVR